MELTQDKLNELKKLAEKATQGEWQIDLESSHIRIVTPDGTCDYPFQITPTPNKEANSAYIAAVSPDVVLALIAENTRLNKQVELWKHDYEELAASAHEDRKKIAQLEKEADWLANKLANWMQDNPDKGFWREAACKSIEESDNE